MTSTAAEMTTPANPITLNELLYPMLQEFCPRSSPETPEEAKKKLAILLARHPDEFQNRTDEVAPQIHANHPNLLFDECLDAIRKILRGVQTEGFAMMM